MRSRPACSARPNPLQGSCRHRCLVVVVMNATSSAFLSRLCFLCSSVFFICPSLAITVLLYIYISVYAHIRVQCTENASYTHNYCCSFFACQLFSFSYCSVLSPTHPPPLLLQSIFRCLCCCCCCCCRYFFTYVLLAAAAAIFYPKNVFQFSW